VKIAVLRIGLAISEFIRAAAHLKRCARREKIKIPCNHRGLFDEYRKNIGRIRPKLHGCADQQLWQIFQE